MSDHGNEALEASLPNPPSLEGSPASTEPEQQSRPKILQTTKPGAGHTIEYYCLKGEMWVRETKNGRTLEMTISAYLRQDLFEQACFFAGIDRSKRMHE